MSTRLLPAMTVALAAATLLATLSSPAAMPAASSSRRHPPSKWVLGPIYATGCPAWGTCGGATDMAGEAGFDLDALAANDIPVTAYHFDGAGWSSGGCAWALGDRLINRLKGANVRAVLHTWGGCDTAWGLLRVSRKLGSVFGGLYLDERSTDAWARSSFDLLQALMPGSGEVVMKAFQQDGLETDSGLAAYGHTAYVGDLPADFAGMRTGVERVFSKSALLPAPYNEFTGYDGRNVPTEEAYFRRLHWGALQMVMEQDCALDCDPWGKAYSPALLAAYRYYSWLHAELVPYLHSYDYRMYETGEPVFRDSDAVKYTTRLGNELFVAYVTQPGATALAVDLPAGEWINYWNDAEIYQGPASIAYPVPLGREPIFIRNGGIIPMQVSRSYTGHGTKASSGSLTVVVYPAAASSFKYRDAGNWVTFSSVLTGTALTLGASPAPSQPVLYRIGRWPSEPVSVGVNGSTVTVNQEGGVPRVTSEDAVNASTTNAWFYDAAAQRLIVKMVTTSTARARPR